MKNYTIVITAPLLAVIISLGGLFGGEPQDETLELALNSRGSLIFYADVCQFEGEGGKTLAEIVYSFNFLQLAADGDSNDPSVVFSVELQLATSENQPPAQIIERKKIPVADTPGEGAGAFMDLKRFMVAADSVTLTLTISDSASTKSGIIEHRFPVRQFNEELSLSDPFFSAHVYKAEEESNFEKHGLVLIPNPSRFFFVGDSASKAYVYYEINNLAYLNDRKSSYSVRYSIEDLSGKVRFSDGKENIVKTGPNSARIETIPLADLASGQYRLSLQVDDLYSGEWTAVRKYFSIVSQIASNTQSLPISPEDIARYRDQIKYIATHEEKELFNQLSPEGVQEFLIQFWKRRDPDPSTSENEFMLEHFKRLAYCENNFRGGINSDMGRVYLQYGPPNDIIRDTFTLKYTRPVESWVYAMEGTVEFFFVDRLEDGNFLLVHSTHVDEFHNENWMNEIR